MTEHVKNERAAPLSTLQMTLDFGVWLVEATVTGALTGLACVAIVATIATVGA